MNTATAALPAPSFFRKIREERGLSQEQVSLALGVPRTHITTLENDELRAKLVRFYGVKPDPVKVERHAAIFDRRIDWSEAVQCWRSAAIAMGLKSLAEADERRAATQLLIMQRAKLAAQCGYYLSVGSVFAMCIAGAVWAVIK